MGEQPALLLEGVGVAQLGRARGGEADVGQEGAGGDLARLARELRISICSERLAAELRGALLVKPAEPRPVGLAMALRRDAVGAPSSQNVARALRRPALIPNRRHIRPDPYPSELSPTAADSAIAAPSPFSACTAR